MIIKVIGLYREHLSYWSILNQIIKMLENNKKNDTVNRLIHYFSEYIKIYENKLKANNLFNEIDERVHKNLSELVYE